MNNFNLRNITDMIFGSGKEERCAEFVKHYGGTRVLIVSDKNSSVPDLLAAIRKNLSDNGLYCVELSEVEKKPQFELGMKGAELCKKDNLDFVLAVGGRNVIDTAKLIAFAAKNDGDIWKFYQSQTVEEEKIYPILPIGAVSSFTGSGSEMTMSSVIYNNEAKRCFSYILMKPKFCILDPEVTYAIPPFETACGISEIFANLIDTFMSTSKDSDLADGMITAGLRTVLKHARIVMSDPANYQSRSELMVIAPMSIYGLTNIGRSGDGAVKELARALPYGWDAPDGAALAVLIPKWMRFIYKEHIDLFVKLAVQVFDIEADVNLEKTAYEAIEATEHFLYDDLKLPDSFSKLGVVGADESAFSGCCEDVFTNGENTVGSTHSLTKDDCMSIYMMCR